jgi:hypothetical protein
VRKGYPDRMGKSPKNYIVSSLCPRRSKSEVNNIGAPVIGAAGETGWLI